GEERTVLVIDSGSLDFWARVERLHIFLRRRLVVESKRRAYASCKDFGLDGRAACLLISDGSFVRQRNRDSEQQQDDGEDGGDPRLAEERKLEAAKGSTDGHQGTTPAATASSFELI